MKKIIIAWLGSLLLIAATAGGLAGLGWYKYREIQISSQTPPPPEMPVSVVLEGVQQTTYRPSTTVIGTVMAPRSIVVSNEIAGTVREMSFEPGGEVQMEQLLLRLDSRMEQAQLEAAKARLRLAESTLKRLRSIPGEDAVSQIELDEARARHDEAKAAVSELSAMIERRSIHAPFRARVGLSDTHVGQYLPAGTPITTLQSLEGFLFVDFMLPQNVADLVRVGDPVKLQMFGSSWDARLFAFDALADRSTRNLKARARIDNPPEQMQPGDSALVVMEYGAPVTATAVPVQAIRRSPSGAIVFVAVDDDKGKIRARARTIHPGPTRGENVLVFSGLAENDKVIADGSFKLQEGEWVMDASTAPKPDHTTTVSGEK